MKNVPSLFLFQLHHTGIKNLKAIRPLEGLNHFNCTIQELKSTSASVVRWVSHFNCTIQELKKPLCAARRSCGIYFNCTIQELKSCRRTSVEPFAANFNCTIQELKTSWKALLSLPLAYFNCTIQELKTCAGRWTFAKISISIAPYRN